MAETEDKKKATPHSLIRLFYRRWRLVLLGAVLFAIGTLIAAHNLPLQYTGTAIFERRKDPVSEDSRAVRSESFEARRETVQHDLAGRDAVSQVIGRLGLTRGMERDASGQFTREGENAKQQLVQQFMSSIKIRWEVRSDQVDLISVSFTHSDPQWAEKMPNALIEDYIFYVSKQSENNLEDSKDFLDQQVTNCSNRLGELIGKRIEFEKENRGLNPENPSLIYENIVQLTDDIENIRLQQAIERESLAILEGMETTPAMREPNLSDEPTQIITGRNPELTRLEEELQRAEEALDEMLNVSRMKEAHRSVQAVRRKIAQLKNRIEETEPTAVIQYVYGTGDPGRDFKVKLLQAQSRIEVGERSLDRWQNRLESYQEILANLAPRRREYMGIIKEIDDKQNELNRWDEDLAQVKRALAAEAAKRRTHLNAVQVSEKQFLPSSPSLIRVVVFALIGGLGLGVGLVLLANWYEQSLVTPEMASRVFGIPVYGYTDEILLPRQLFFRGLKRWILVPVLAVILIIILGLSVYSLNLKLYDTEKYDQWCSAPVQFLSEEVTEKVQQVEDYLTG